HGDTGKEVNEVAEVPSNRLLIVSPRRLLHAFSYPTDSVETIASSIPPHSVTNDADGIEIVLPQCCFNLLHITPPILEKSWNDLFKAWVDIHGDPTLCLSILPHAHVVRRPLQAWRTSRSVCFLRGLVIWASQPASRILTPSSFSARAVKAIIWVGGRSCSRSQILIDRVAS